MSKNIIFIIFLIAISTIVGLSAYKKGQNDTKPITINIPELQLPQISEDSIDRYCSGYLTEDLNGNVFKSRSAHFVVITAKGFIKNNNIWCVAKIITMIKQYKKESIVYYKLTPGYNYQVDEVSKNEIEQVLNLSQSSI